MCEGLPVLCHIRLHQPTTVQAESPGFLLWRLLPSQLYQGGETGTAIIVICTEQVPAERPIVGSFSLRERHPLLIACV